MQTSKEHTVFDGFAEAGRADWELVITKHVRQRASAGLRAVCGQACVSLGALEEAAGEVGMDKAEVRSALLLLHATGSVLHYGTDTRRGSQALQGTVFMQPQFIIDAIKYVIREPSAADINDEVRALDTRIRQNAGYTEVLDWFLGTGAEAHSSGVLTRQLLTHLWRHLNPRQHTVLLDLMKAFKLLRPLADKDTFLVPAMLPRRALPDEYVMPDWWRPSKAADVAVMKVEDVARPAEMRIMYKVLGGSLPFGFMSELQVRLAQTDCVDQDEELHFAPEAAVVDRVSGSVLSVAYTCGGGTIREWVILSRAHEGVSEACDAPDCLRIMGWAHLSSQHGATDWRLFQRVLQAIEKMAESAPGLSLQKMAFYVNTNGQLAKPLEITARTAKRHVFSFALEGGGKVDVRHDLVLPSILETKLSRPEQPLQQTAASEGIRHCVDAFFAKKIDDHQINVHAEGQLMARIVLDPGCGWDCKINPQPTIEDLYSSIKLSRQRNVRVLHLAGHGENECGFIWNASDSATAQQKFDVNAISLAIGLVAGQNGPMECAVLNTCSTEKMGRLLRQRGVPHVLCWRTPVKDETAKELCEHFYRALIENQSGAREYKQAFLAATNAVRSTAHTGGAACLHRGAEDVAAGICMLHGSNTRSVGPEGGGSSRGKVLPWFQQDVVLFLSKDGDSDPIYLWRERLTLPPAISDVSVIQESGAAEEPGDVALKDLFVQHQLGMLYVDVCMELGIEKVGDLAGVDRDMLDDLPNYLKDQIILFHKNRLLALIGLPPPACTGLTPQLSVPMPAAEEAGGTSAASTRHGDPPCQQQVFLGYRVASDADLVERLHDKLKAEGVKV